jgi:hypothetical protein
MLKREHLPFLILAVLTVIAAFITGIFSQPCIQSAF